MGLSNKTHRFWYLPWCLTPGCNPHCRLSAEWDMSLAASTHNIALSGVVRSKCWGPAGSCNFSKDSCIFLTEKIWMLKISILSPKFPQRGDFQLQILYVEERFPTRKSFFQQATGGLVRCPPAALPPFATTQLIRLVLSKQPNCNMAVLACFSYFIYSK